MSEELAEVVQATEPADDGIRRRLEEMEPTEEELAGGRLKAQEKFKLVEAIRSLLDGRPTHDRLKQMLKDQGRVPITQKTVMIESGVARQRFSGGERHADVAELLQDLKADYGSGKTQAAKLKRQSRTIELLQQQLVASRSATAAQVARIDALKLKLKRANDRIERLKAGEEEEDED